MTGGEPSLSQDILDLFGLLDDRHIPCVLVGGVALLKYIDGRNTEDLDFLLPPDALLQLPELVASKREHDAVRAQFRGVRVDLLLTTDPVFKLVFETHSTTHRFQEVQVRCATVEGLLLLKLYALPSLYRQGDTQRIAIYETDILMLADRYRPSLTEVLQSLRPYVDEGAMAELGTIIFDIEQRIARMHRRNGGVA
jgi:hypothetical protein